MLPSCDILVVGGGVAGLPAAVTAARAGMNVVLAERDEFLGGSGVTALHRYLCGFYPNGTKVPSEPLNPGISGEILDGCKIPGALPLQMGRSWGVPFEPRRLKELYARLAREESKIAHWSSASVESVECSHARIRTVTLQTTEGLLTFAPQTVIDATGDGAVIRLSGAPFHDAPQSQMNAVTVHMERLQGDMGVLALKIPWQLGHLGTEQILPFAGFTPGCGEQDAFCKFSIPLGLESEDEIHSRVVRMGMLLAERIPEMRDLQIIGISSILKRDGVRLDGEWTLDEKAILYAHKFSDGVVRNAWPMESWDSGAYTPTYEYPPDDDFYEIPRRCLRSRTISNLFAAGRCISARTKALSSTRPMGTCMALGEAAANEAIRWCRATQQM